MRSMYDGQDGHEMIYRSASRVPEGYINPTPRAGFLFPLSTSPTHFPTTTLYHFSEFYSLHHLQHSSLTPPIFHHSLPYPTPTLPSQSTNQPTMFSSLLSLLLVVPAVLAGPCHEDNCYRAVVRKWQGEEVFQRHMAECVVNLGCTETPAASTVTSVETVTAGTITIKRTAETATATGPGATVTAGVKCGTGNIPSDQSNQCENNFANYATACKCAGNTGATATIAQATATVVVKVTEPAKVVYE